MQSSRKARKMSKFDNIKTTANVAIVDVESGNTTFEIVEIPYTRTAAKAVEFARAALGLDESATIALVGIEHEKQAPKTYNLGKVFDNAKEVTSEKPEKLENGFIAIPRTKYSYFAYVYGIEKLEDGTVPSTRPFATAYKCESANAYTKGNAREYIAMRYQEENPTHEIVCIYGNMRETLGQEWAIIEVKKAAKYEVNEQ